MPLEMGCIHCVDVMKLDPERRHEIARKGPDYVCSICEVHGHRAVEDGPDAGRCPACEFHFAEREAHKKALMHVGRFLIGRDFYQHELGSVQWLFARVVPMRVEYRYECGAFEVIGVSSMFRLVQEGELQPHYNIYLTVDETGISCEAKEGEYSSMLSTVNGPVCLAHNQ